MEKYDGFVEVPDEDPVHVGLWIVRALAVPSLLGAVPAAPAAVTRPVPAATTPVRLAGWKKCVKLKNNYLNCSRSKNIYYKKNWGPDL